MLCVQFLLNKPLLTNACVDEKTVKINKQPEAPFSYLYLSSNSHTRPILVFLSADGH